MKGIFIPDITAEMFRNGCLESIEALMAEGKIYDIDYSPWIPCSERLPEERGCYIVTEKVFSVDDREHKGRYKTIVEQVEYYDGKWKRASFFEVVAWMPRPQPYKQEGEE